MTLRALHWAPADARRTSLQPSILLIHGLGDTADIWRPLMEHWRPPAATLAVDLPGHGRSPHLLPNGYACARLADEVAQVLMEHGISRPVLVGHSLGARICADLATRLELRVRSTVLIDIGVSDDIGVGDGTVGTAIAAHIDAVTAGSPTLDGLCALFFDRLPLAERDAINHVVPAMAVTSADRWHVPLDPAIKSLLTPPVGDDLWQTLSQVAGPRQHHPRRILRRAQSSCCPTDRRNHPMPTCPDPGDRDGWTCHPDRATRSTRAGP